MPSPPDKAPAGIDVNLIHSRIWPRLEALGVEQIEIQASGPGGRVDLAIGYRLRPGVSVRPGVLREATSAAMPASVDYHSLMVCRIEDMPPPESAWPDGSTEGTGASVRRRWPLVLAVLAIAALVGVFLVIVTWRGETIARAELGSGGKAVTYFESDGRSKMELWATLDGEWRGVNDGVGRTLRKILPVAYEIDFVHEGRVVRHLALDTRKPPPFMNVHCTIAPDCDTLLGELAPLPAGVIEVRVLGTPRKDVTAVRDMSLEVRSASPF